MINKIIYYIIFYDICTISNTIRSTLSDIKLDAVSNIEKLIKIVFPLCFLYELLKSF